MPVTRLLGDAGRVVAHDAEVERLFEGLEGGEGPVWIKEQGCLVFSDLRVGLRYRWHPSDGVTVIDPSTDHGNGMARDVSGELLVCERSNGLVLINADGERSAVATAVDGTPLRFTIDVAVRSDGLIYFTGSTTANLADAGLLANPDGTRTFIEPRRDAAGAVSTGFDILRTRRDGSGDATVAFADVLLPNGLAFSPDESLLYVADTRGAALYAIPVAADGALDPAGAWVLCDFSRTAGVGVADGLAVDRDGRIYCTGPGGIWILEPSGERLGTISVGEHEYHTNCAFGGPDLKTLYITTHHMLARIDLEIPGLELPLTTHAAKQSEHST